MSSKPVRARAKLLDQQLVTEFGEFRALKTKIEKWLDTVRDGLLEQFGAGYVCPTDGPFLLEVSESNRSNISWKEEYFLRLRGDFESSGSASEAAEQLAIAKMAEMERIAGSKKVPSVLVKPNPSFGSKVMRAIVKKLDARNARGF